MRLLKVGLAGAVFAALTIAQLLSAAPASALNPTDCRPTPATWDSALASLAGPKKPGWASSDGFASVALNNHQTLILAGDTFYGTTTAGGTVYTPGVLKRNLGLVVDDLYPGCWRTLAGTTTSGLFPAGPDSTKDWYWPGIPVVSGTTVAVPLSRMGARPGGAGDPLWNFVHTGSDVKTFTWNGSALLPRSARSIGFERVDPTGGKVAWSSQMVQGSWVYMFGNDLTPGAWGHEIHLARVPASEYFSTHTTPLGAYAQFLTNTGWSASATHTTLKKVIGFEADSGVSPIWTGTEFHIVTKTYSIVGTEIVDFHGPTLEGPLTRSVLMKAPVRDETVSYLVALQPSLGNTGNTFYATINYTNSNTSLDWLGLWSRISRFRPALLTLTLPETSRAVTATPIQARHKILGGATGPLGPAVALEHAGSGASSRHGRFSRGDIWFVPPLGAFETYGAIGGLYRVLGADSSALGMPRSGEVAGMVAGVRKNFFANGAIFYTAASGAHEVHGGVWAKYKLLGAEKSKLGLPTSNQYNVSGGVANNFAHGRIVFNVTSGVAAVSYW